MLCAAGAGAAEVRTSADKNVISTGETTRLVITVKGGSVDLDGTVIPRVQGLNITYGGTGSSYQYFNGKSSSTTTLTFYVYGEKEGSYIIPPFTVSAGGEKHYTQPVSIKVVKGTAADPDDNSIKVFCDAELSVDSCYSGQPVILRYYIFHDARTELNINRIVKPPVSDGFIVKQVKESIAAEDTVKNGMNFIKEHIVTYCLIPEITGSRTAGGGSMLVSAGRGRVFFSRPARGELVFPEKKLRVMALPEKGRPSGYSGDVGEFKLEAVIKSGRYMVNEEIGVPVTVTGKGNFFVMSKPVFENTGGLRILVEESEPELELAGGEISGSKKFFVTIIPQNEGDFKPGALALKYFNPAERVYVTTASESLSLEISGTVATAESKKDETAEAVPGLSPFAYAGAGLLLGAALFGLFYIISRERRRYAGINSAEIKKSPERKSVKAEPAELLRKELEGAHGSGDSEKLMKLCIMAVEMINGAEDERRQVELALIKGKLEAARYANALLGDDELEAVYGKLMALLRQGKQP